jgi:hypothetical protein
LQEQESRKAFLPRINADAKGFFILNRIYPCLSVFSVTKKFYKSRILRLRIVISKLMAAIVMRVLIQLSPASRTELFPLSA